MIGKGRAERAAAWCAALIAVAILSVAPDAVATPDATAAAHRIVELVNAFRHEQGLGSVQQNGVLDAAASEFAGYLAAHRVLSHEADGRTPVQRAEAHGYAHCIVDENIAFEQRSPDFTSVELAQALVQGWRNSPPHRRNILDRDVTETGVAIARDPRSGRWYAVQMFGAPAKARRVFEVTNASAAMVRYRLGDVAFELAPGETRTHAICRSLPLAISGAADAGAVQPAAGAHYEARANGSGLVELGRR